VRDPKGSKGARKKEHARFIAQRIGAEKPYLAKTGSYIRVRDEKGGEIFEAPIQAGYVLSLT
jgi:hypothetical protein